MEKSLLKAILIGTAAIVCVMVALTSYWAVARDGGLAGWILAVVWAVGGVLILGAILRGIAKQ